MAPTVYFFPSQPLPQQFLPPDAVPAPLSPYLGYSLAALPSPDQQLYVSTTAPGEIGDGLLPTPPPPGPGSIPSPAQQTPGYMLLPSPTGSGLYPTGTQVAAPARDSPASDPGYCSPPPVTVSMPAVVGSAVTVPLSTDSFSTGPLSLPPGPGSVPSPTQGVRQRLYPMSVTTQ